MAKVSGFKFKVLTTSELAKIVNAVSGLSAGAHPPVTSDALDKPTPETAAGVFQMLAEYAYDTEIQQVKIEAQRTGTIQHQEIYEEALDVLTLFRWCRQVANINSIDDFTFKDVWDPSQKRFRAVVSALCNFDRYKESRETKFDPEREELQALDDQRADLLAKTNHMEEEVAQSQEIHLEELREIGAKEQEVEEMKSSLEKRMRDQQSAERVVEDLQGQLNAARDKVEEVERQIGVSRDEVSDMKARIAENPAGIQREIEDQKSIESELRERLAKTGDEKRAKVQRDQVLKKVFENCKEYELALTKTKRDADAHSEMRSRVLQEREELAALRARMDSMSNENVEIEQHSKQIGEELASAQKEKERKLQELETRRLHAYGQLTTLQAKRTDEQKKAHQVQAQKLELEVELDNTQRQLDAELNDLNADLAAKVERREYYDQQVDSMISQYRGDMSGSRRAPSPDVEDAAGTKRAGGLRARRLLASPSPARATAGRRLPATSPYRGLP